MDLSSRIGLAIMGLGILAGVAGCGAMLNGREQMVYITTVPPGAEISVDGQTLHSPAHVSLRRDRDYTVKVSRQGFQEGEATLRHVPDGQVRFGNLLLLGIPWLWEAGDPSQYRLDPPDLDVHLDPAGWSPR